MCGIVGEFRPGGGKADAEAVNSARERLEHRGPDEAGDWSEGPVAFGFRRLSILDLERGRQPMRTADGRFTIVYNGETYNHLELRRGLEKLGTKFRTHNDAETVLELYARDGSVILNELEGMFAFAVFDRLKNEVLLARDPLGVKPLYYAFDGKRLVFASELKALTSLLPELSLDPAGVLDYLSHGFTHGPRTVIDSAMKLLPGHLLRVNAHGLRIEKYWELPARPPAGPGPTLKEAVDEIEKRLIASVRSQLLSDVPVGAFLSGGVDSSLITALMCRASQEKVKTFSIGFQGTRAGLDESSYARAVARYLGTDHHELILPADVLSRIDDLFEALDEPIADSAILPTLLLSRFARKHVKVVLTGEGADELFAGYNRYKAAYLSDRVKGVPAWGRGAAGAIARRLGRGRIFEDLPHRGVGSWAKAFAHSGSVTRENILTREFLNKSAKVDPWEWLKNPEEPASLAAAQAFDLRAVLCDSLLMKVDKSTMRAGLEARVPYLDRRLVEYAIQLPNSTKIRRLKGKYALRRLAEKYLPRPIAWRKKHGFVVPWEEWVRAPANDRLDAFVRSGAGPFDRAHLQWMRDDLKAGGGQADAGLFFRAAVLGLWLESLPRSVRC